ncbi:hypothetical protein F4813DRAFT_385632 [Daldinia decipiens]|uniref:uncharacterized protein n=1 Tax=Daldinia decipiens TaxID=326647 RepID=UPI0020C4763F|nr:uncharacterized protein F4813DRAFT_385632 [Daldinia decipiens]KAI1661960.1 hypothetical protein F4813DRAFT_385632 [Daldinia decipiens]
MDLSRLLICKCTYDFSRYYAQSNANTKKRMNPQGPWKTNSKTSLETLGDRSYIIDTNLAYTSKFFSREVLTYMYSKMCTCTILYHISTNDLLSISLERIKFLWTGLVADRAITELRRLPLTRMTVVIGAFTTVYLTRQEALFRRYFQRATAHVTQALGVFELLELRGIESVRVECYGHRLALMSEDDRLCLEHLLVEHVSRTRVR